MPRIALVTSSDTRDLTPGDRLLVNPLETLGFEVSSPVWNDPTVDWIAFDAAVIRSTWNYYYHADQFSSWIDRLETEGVNVWNPPSIIKWNMTKLYLRELDSKGIHTIPTVWLENPTPNDLHQILDENGWNEAVIKPVVSAGAYQTYRISGQVPGSRLADLPQLPEGTWLLQPYLSQIVTEGEISLCFFMGDFSHAIIKRPREGDFRVQREHGGAYTPFVPDEGILHAARRVIDCSASSLLYARVDGIMYEGEFHLMELELIEPDLYLEFDRDAPTHFANAIHSVTS